ncbi:Crp/Fnr family transcriptional regulator [Mucilaginibacter agri]|uniref:Cyclic nucleotide-binding domain-containing protein n=1 Tax=Mucilaginibacter agri TaxID=2695265 RepID=A0A965ZJF8_9SPHI|nr:Crp/Fnr family transcriptional regulator [Mucilaginibacter agri]NCD70832.1 cyclic nucleotide-binding domain-containing protein [Mucilaginibacter agri]
MFAEFERFIREQASVTDEDIQLMRANAVERTLRRKDLLLQAGDVCRYKTFISKGFLRTYRTTDDGSEHIMQFSPENSWTTDGESYENGTPSFYNIEALESSEVVMWTRKDFNSLFEQIPQLKAYSDKLIFSNLARTRQRVFTAISATAEEKYDEFIQLYPGIINRVPLHMVASFLGVSRETLSRIRHAQVRS